MSSEALQALLGAVEIIEQYAYIDGAHHKQWIIDQVMRRLQGEHKKKQKVSGI